MDITAAEEEITRWKIAAQQEAAAGKAVEQEYVAQVYLRKGDSICFSYLLSVVIFVNLTGFVYRILNELCS